MPPAGYAQVLPSVLNLPMPGTMVHVSAGFYPPIIRGVMIDPENPLKFDFGERYLKVMLEEDYVAMQKSMSDQGTVTSDQVNLDTSHQRLATNIVKQLIIPELEREVNEGEHFANLRQIFNSMILATWYKTALKNSLLGQVYVDQNKTKGVDVSDPTIKEKIYQQYLEAYKLGAFNYIKEDIDRVTNEVVPRKYFSGGFTGKAMKVNLTKKSLYAASPIERTQMLRSKSNKTPVIIPTIFTESDNDPLALAASPIKDVHLKDSSDEERLFLMKELNGLMSKAKQLIFVELGIKELDLGREEPTDAGFGAVLIAEKMGKGQRAAASPVRAVSIESLSENSLISNVHNMQKPERRNQLLHWMVRFLARDHPIKIKVFDEVDGLIDSDIINAAENALVADAKSLNNLLGNLYQDLELYRNRTLTLREFYLHPGTGAIDVPEALLSAYMYSNDVIDRTAFGGNLPREIEGRLKSVYTLIRALEILSRDSDMVLLQEKDIDDTGDLMIYINYYSRKFTHYTDTDVVISFLQLSELFVDQQQQIAVTPAQKESLKNLIALFEKLEAMDTWSETLQKEGFPERIAQLKEINAKSANSPLATNAGYGAELKAEKMDKGQWAEASPIKAMKDKHTISPIDLKDSSIVEGIKRIREMAEKLIEFKGELKGATLAEQKKDLVRHVAVLERVFNQIIENIRLKHSLGQKNMKLITKSFLFDNVNYVLANVDGNKIRKRLIRKMAIKVVDDTILDSKISEEIKLSIKQIYETAHEIVDLLDSVQITMKISDQKAGSPITEIVNQYFSRVSTSNESLETGHQKGGIDFNADHLNLQIKRDGNGVPLPLNLQPIESMNIDGLYPVILNVAPITVPMLLSRLDLPVEESLSIGPADRIDRFVGRENDVISAKAEI